MLGFDGGGVWWRLPPGPCDGQVVRSTMLDGGCDPVDLMRVVVLGVVFCDLFGVFATLDYG